MSCNIRQLHKLKKKKMSSKRKKKKDEPIEESTIVKTVLDHNQNSGVSEDVKNHKRHEDIDAEQLVSNCVFGFEDDQKIQPKRLKEDPDSLMVNNFYVKEAKPRIKKDPDEAKIFNANNKDNFQDSTNIDNSGEESREKDGEGPSFLANPTFSDPKFVVIDSKIICINSPSKLQFIEPSNECIILEVNCQLIDPRGFYKRGTKVELLWKRKKRPNEPSPLSISYALDEHLKFTVDLVTKRSFYKDYNLSENTDNLTDYIKIAKVITPKVSGSEITGSQNTDSENTISESTDSENTDSESTDSENADSENNDSKNTDSEIISHRTTDCENTDYGNNHNENVTYRSIVCGNTDSKKTDTNDTVTVNIDHRNAGDTSIDNSAEEPEPVVYEFYPANYVDMLKAGFQQSLKFLISKASTLKEGKDIKIIPIGSSKKSCCININTEFTKIEKNANTTELEFEVDFYQKDSCITSACTSIQVPYQFQIKRYNGTINV